MADVGSNAYWDGYIADNDDANKVYFSVPPNPQYFLPIPERTTISKKNLPDTSNSGQTIHVDFGAHESDIVIPLHFDELTDAEKAALKTKYDALESVYFSPDDGVTKYECIWRTFRAILERGRQSWTCDVELAVIQTV